MKAFGGIEKNFICVYLCLVTGLDLKRRRLGNSSFALNRNSVAEYEGEVIAGG